MGMDPLNEAFHASSVNAYITCPRAYYYRHVLKMEEESANFSAFQGTAMHSAIESWHRAAESDVALGVDELVDMFEGHVRGLVQWAYDGGKTVDGYDGEASIASACTEFAEPILKGYTEDPRNHVELAANEAAFSVQIGTKDQYPFEGRVDQVRRVSDGIELADIKTGKTKPSQILLDMDYQISVYNHACWKGVFTDPEFPEREPWRLDAIPVRTHIIHVRDYIPKKKNQYAEFITTDEYEVNPDTGRKRKKKIPNPKFDEGYKKGDIGQVFYTTTRSEHDLVVAAQDLTRVCGAIRFKMFFRRPVAQGACVGFCRYTGPCQEERRDPELNEVENTL